MEGGGTYGLGHLYTNTCTTVRRAGEGVALRPRERVHHGTNALLRKKKPQGAGKQETLLQGSSTRRVLKNQLHSLLVTGCPAARRLPRWEILPPHPGGNWPL